ncbi:hypothetical protein ACQPYA_03690 [Micromonospora sp. CA-263727]|uniref:hypothetical protein n=1 Tax=Micromonospora sp. CA-263727 TaxID=3239967 RepID=UPI003D8E6BFC
MFASLVQLSPGLIILVGLVRARPVAHALIFVIAALVMIVSRDPGRIDRAKYVLDAPIRALSGRTRSRARGENRHRRTSDR